MTTQLTHTGGDLIAAALEAIARIDDAKVNVRGIDIDPWKVFVQLTTEDDVDRAIAQMGHSEPDAGVTANYSRTATLDGLTVRVYSPRTERRCICGGRCNHRSAS